MKYAYGHQRQRILAKPRPCWAFISHGSICWLVSLCFARVFASAFALLFICAAGARIDHNPPFFAFSSRLHFPKSVYEGNFGCGYLKERRASGLVFCENTTSVYRALFVSPSVFLLPFVSNGDCQSVALLMRSAPWWNDVACFFSFSCMISVTMYLLYVSFVKCNTALILKSTSDDEMNKPSKLP